jgi:hypothetical protein
MSIRFAAARAGECTAVSRVLCRPKPGTPANDCDGILAQDALLQCALRHFAQHGLGAAEQARDIARRAIAEGDREQYQHWLGVCRKLDRRIAAQLKARHGDAC